MEMMMVDESLTVSEKGLISKVLEDHRSRADPPLLLKNGSQFKKNLEVMFNPAVPLLCPVEQNNVFEDSRSLYQFTFVECEAQSCDFRNKVNWPGAVHLLLQLVPYVQLRSGTQKQ
ncbi:hypothetical protein cypCar_00039759 [Cyprinus carpio]|nr:hypothetical protein cypCar_00039759 [Cyprinus carpio]